MAQEEKKKKNRLGYMILSVIIAIIAWSVVTYTTDPDITKTFAGIRVELTGEDVLAENGYVVVAREDIPKVSVKMRGKRSDLIKAIDRARVVIDVSELDESGEFEIEGTVKLPNSRITVERVSMPSIPVRVAALETKEVPVRITQTGELPGKLVKSTPQKDTVTIKGAKSELDQIVAAEVALDIATATDGAPSELGYSLILADGISREMLTTLLITENVVAVNNTIYDAKEVPVRVIVKGDGDGNLNVEETEIEPKSITVGISEGMNIEYVTVAIDAKAEEGEYKIEKSDDAYIPDNSRTVTVKPVWDK
ncbi:MAG: hypothetical protein IJC09_01500 [Clostridia bacterium]|nr:hypothetical protein [Clostridia bacterium]